VLSNIELFILSMALGTDLFSVAIPIGMRPMKWPIVFRAALIFAVFHIVFILAGYYIGNFMGGILERMGTYSNEYPVLAVENWASILGALVLATLGIYMIKENLYPGSAEQGRKQPLQGFSLIFIATSVSIDALAAGFSMGMMEVNLVRLSLMLGAVIFIIALVGLGLGRRIGCYVGKRAELIGGVVLILLGLHLLWRMFF
jgi:putative Mn2+ efflux pump MntP